MKSFNYVITDEQGMHVRPAGLLAKQVKKYSSEISIERDGKKINCAKLMAVMALGIKKGDSVDVIIEGEDEEKAFEEVKAFFEENL